MENQLVEREFAKLQAWITAGLAFVLISTITITSLMFWTAYNRGKDASRIEALAIETHNNFCAYKQSLIVNQKEAVGFLKENPSGIPGIARETIERSIQNRQETLDALKNLECS